jgi:hypothetical protein
MLPRGTCAQRMRFNAGVYLLFAGSSASVICVTGQPLRCVFS